MSDASLARVLRQALKLFSLSNAPDIVVEACREARAISGARFVVAAYAPPHVPWERGLHLVVRGDSHAALSPEARSSMFAVHRRLAMSREQVVFESSEDASILRGIARAAPELGPDVPIARAVPVLHSKGRLVGEIVLACPAGSSHEQADALSHLAALTSVALSQAQRLFVAQGAQERLMLVAETTDEALWDWNVDTAEVWWGGAVQKFVRGEPVVQTRIEWKDRRIHPDDVGRVHATLAECLRSSQTSWSEAYRFLRGDGSWAHVQDHGYVLREASGRAYRVIGALRDVTALHEAQTRLLEEISQRNQERFRHLVESVSDHAIFMLDRGGRVETWNSGAQKIKGYEPSEIIGEHFSIFYTPEDRANGKPEKVLAIARDEGRYGEEGWRVRKDGSRFWADVVVTALRGTENEIIGFAKVTRDLTERRKAEENELARRELESVNRAKDDFLAVMGHELRNPLAAMLTAVHLIKLRDGVQCERQVAVLERQLFQMVRLLDDLVDVSRLIRDQVDLKKRPMEISTIVANAVEVAALLVEKKGHMPRLDIPPESLVVDVDNERIAQVFGNLLTNAAKYTEDGGEIRVRARGTEEEIVVTVEDTGIGIDPQMLPRIFELFVQGPQARERQLGGFGVGLAVARKLVVQHGGRIRAESDGLGLGSRFIVTLPRSSAVIDAPPRSPPSLRRASVHRRVLVVDDNKDSAEMLQELLEQLGHEVRVALDAPEALVIAGRFKPEIAFLDIGLPTMSGFELARRLRQIAECATIPIIAVSGYARDIDRRDALSAGFTDHFSKPIELTRLESLVERAAQPAD